MRRLSRECGTSLDDLLNAARTLLKQNPKLSPEQIDTLLRSAT